MHPILLYFFLFSVFSILSIVSAQNKTDLETYIEEQKLQISPITSITLKVLDLDPSSHKAISGTEKILSQDVFNKQGTQIEKHRYDQNWGYTYTDRYDDQGDWIENSRYNSDGSVEFQFKMKFDNLGNKIERFEYPASKTIFEFDEHGNEIKHSKYNADNKLETQITTEYIYDELGNKIRELKYKADSSLGYQKDFTYDKYGNLSEEFETKNSSGIDIHFKYQYDELGNQIETSSHLLDGSLETLKIYDVQGHLLEQSHYNANGSLHYKKEYNFDEKGNKTQYSFYNSKGLQSQNNTAYTYDEYGNILENSTSDHKIVYKYDEKGNQIELSRYNAEGNLGFQHKRKVLINLIGIQTGLKTLTFFTRNKMVSFKQSIILQIQKYLSV